MQGVLTSEIDWSLASLVVSLFFIRVHLKSKTIYSLKG